MFTVRLTCERPSRVLPPPSCTRGGMLKLSPLCGGLPPDIAWPYLKRVGEVVLPAVAKTADNGLDDTLNDLLSTKGA